MKVPMSDLVKEFKAFAFKGNMLDLAVAVVIGVAFGAVVNSLVKDIIMPLVGWVVGLVFQNDGGYRGWHIGPIMLGSFLGEVLNFLAIAAAVFVVVVKVLGTLVKKAAPLPAAGSPVAKECPFCISEISIKATRCKFCTADLAKK